MSDEREQGHGDFATGQEADEDHEHHEGSFAEGQAEDEHEH